MLVAVLITVPVVLIAALAFSWLAANTSIAVEPTSATQQKIATMLGAPHHSTNLLVRFKDTASPAALQTLNTDAGAVVKKAYRHVNVLHLVKILSGDLDDALAAYLASGDVLYAEPDYRIYASTDPNDPEFDRQWGLKNTGQCLGDPLCLTGSYCDLDPGIPGAHIGAVQAWDFWTGAEEFKIAVLDTGFDCDHLDLASNVWINPGETGDGRETNGVDDDGNGWIDDVNGYNFIGEDGAACGTGDLKHGTHVAGIIGAHGNNGRGIAGVNWRCKIVALVVVGGGLADLMSNAIDGGATVTNSILWGNTADGSAKMIYNSPGTTTAVTYTDCQQKRLGTGNLWTNPLFTDSTNDDYTLSGTSPCIDVGDNDSVPLDVGDLDWDGNFIETEQVAVDLGGQSLGEKRFRGLNCVADMGAYERQVDCSFP